MVESCVKHHDPDPYPEPNPDPYPEPEHSVNQKDIFLLSDLYFIFNKTFHCGNDTLTPTLVGIVSVFQNLRSTLLLPFHSVSSAYLPPPRGTLTGMFNA